LSPLRPSIHAGRKARSVERYLGFHNKRRIVLLALPELRLFDRLSGDWLPHRVVRTARRGADAEGSTNQKPPYAHVHALKAQSDAGQFLKMRGAGRFRGAFYSGRRSRSPQMQS